MLVFLDFFHPDTRRGLVSFTALNDGTDGTDTPAVLDVSTITVMEASFLSSVTDISALLEPSKLSYDAEGGFISIIALDGSVLSMAGLIGMGTLLESKLCESCTIDFAVVAKESLRMAGEYIGRAVPSLLEVGGSFVRDVTVSPTSICGEPFMVPFEVAFETNAASRTLAVPNAPEFTPAHWAASAKHLGRPVERAHQGLYHACLNAPAHEAVHFAQARTSQVDTSSMSWSAEHDASVLSNAIFTLCGRGIQDVLALGDGVVEEVKLCDVRAGMRSISEWGDEVRIAYARWIESFGTAPPILPGELVDQSTTTGQFKGLCAVDGDVFIGPLAPSDPESVCSAVLVAMLSPDRPADVIAGGPPPIPSSFSNMYHPRAEAIALALAPRHAIDGVLVALGLV